ncbi:TadE/TadG family type IV pilus assembly protein [Nocardioides sp. R-C-SC26]|uniref:TadE/TadG family type IV pilus assembly protein n=1 Tax=Nocardioides sp. R-C-SC26 TaxID=2870414 RepID=UPI001E432631|nr:TadE family protein [Nocardioides sp. R-C-SC26]
MGSAGRRRTSRGAAAVEFALVMVPMLYLVFGAIGYGYMFSFRQALSQSAAEGARGAVGAYNPTDGTCAATGPYTATTCPAQAAAATAVANAVNTYGMTCGTKYLTCTIRVGATPTVTGCATGHTCISVTVTYPYRAHSLLPSLPGYGFVLPQDLTFTSVVQLT